MTAANRIQFTESGVPYRAVVSLMNFKLPDANAHDSSSSPRPFAASARLLRKTTLNQSAQNSTSTRLKKMTCITVQPQVAGHVDQSQCRFYRVLLGADRIEEAAEERSSSEEQVPHAPSRIDPHRDRTADCRDRSGLVDRSVDPLARETTGRHSHRAGELPVLFPLTTCILLSVLLSAIMWLIRHFSR